MSQHNSLTNKAIRRQERAERHARRETIQNKQKKDALVQRIFAPAQKVQNLFRKPE